ncbi:MAG: glutamate--tRNA ligase [Thermofilum sp.]
MELDVRQIARKHALANAVKFGGVARVDAVVSKVFAEVPELRKQARDVVKVVQEVVEEVNAMSREDQERLLAEIWPDAFKVEKKREEKRLPPLPRVEELGGFVVTRFAPNPDFALHLGSARPAVLSFYYAKRMYRGKFILRFEDTDPKTKRPMPEAYDAIREDLKWLGVSWDEEYIQSLRMEIYYEHAKMLIERGGAYVCLHSREEISRMRSLGIPDPCRDLPVEVQLERWDRMLSGEYGEEEAVVRIKTDPAHPNPSVRDWIAMRIIDTSKYPHPLVGDKYVVWPTYNYACALDDHLMGVTHILRGEEHAVNTLKQEYIYRHMGWKPPVGIHFGRLNLGGMILSKSVMRKGIEKGLFEGWDDIRLGTLKALRRRGILPETIWELILEVGLRPSSARISVEKLHAVNRKLLEPRANRYMFVTEPLTVVKLEGLSMPAVAEIIVHPSFPERGRRRIEVKEHRVFVGEEVKRMGEVRLMGLGNFSVRGDALIFLNNDVSYAKEKNLQIVQWAPVEEAVPGEVLKAAGTKVEEVKGYGEPEIARLPVGEQVQLVRVGFAKVEKKGEEGVVFIYTHD